MEVQIGIIALENSLALTNRAEPEHNLQLCHSTSGEIVVQILQGGSVRICTATLFLIAKTRKQPKYP